MKKSLLALAVIGAFASAAQAQTNVSIGGVLQMNVKDYSVGSTSLPSAVRNPSHEFRVDDDFNSRFWLTGTEDLGGGNSAVFYVENRLNSDVNMIQATGAGLASGDTWVGLKGAWGQATLGKFSWLSVQGLATEFVNPGGGAGIASFSAMPTSMTGTYSILNEYNGAYLDITRRMNAIQYISPNMGGFFAKVGLSAASAGNEGNMNCTGAGLTGIVSVVPAAGSTTQTATCPQITTAGASNYSDGREYFLQGNYFNGPLGLQLGYRNSTAEGRTGIDDKQLRFSGYYALPMGLKIGLQLDRAQRSTASGANMAGATSSSISRNAWEVPISYTFGRNSIMGSFTRAGDAGTTAGDTGAKLYTLGWDVALSKRTNVGVYYSKLSNDTRGTYQPFLAGTSFTGSALAAGESASTVAVGVKHVF